MVGLHRALRRRVPLHRHRQGRGGKCHNAGRGAAYTRAHRPVRELYREVGLTRAEALVREAKIKALPRPLKVKLARAGTEPRA